MKEDRDGWKSLFIEKQRIESHIEKKNTNKKRVERNKVLERRERILQCKFLSPVKLSFKNEGKKKTLFKQTKIEGICYK